MWARLRSLFRGSIGRSRVEHDLSDELDFHLKTRTDHWISQGLPPSEAARRARARVRLGRALQGSVAARARTALARRAARRPAVRASHAAAPPRASRSSRSRCSPSRLARTPPCSACSTPCSSAMLPVERAAGAARAGVGRGSASKAGRSRTTDRCGRIPAAGASRTRSRIRCTSTSAIGRPRSAISFSSAIRALTVGMAGRDERAIDARRQWELRRRAGRGHIARPADLARGRPGRRAARGRAHQHRMAAALR